MKRREAAASFKFMQELPVRKNQQVELEITALSSEGQGIGRYEGYAVFVPFALPGEKVLAHIIKTTSSYAVGKLVRILEESPRRVPPRCPAFGRCGGCALQHLDYEAQLESKRRQVADALQRIGGVEDAQERTLPTIGMERPWRYRNKGSFPFAMEGGKAAGGFFAPRSHRLIPLEDCPIQQEAGVSAMKAVREWADLCGVKAYDEQRGTGVLRHVMTRTTLRGETMAVIVTTGPLPAPGRLCDLLQKNVKGLCSVVHNINKADTNVILGNRFKTLWGADTLSESICGLNFEVSAASFLQVNPLQTQRLYQTALEYAGLSGKERVVDAYCGIGTISLALAQRAGEVIGIEIVAPAIEDARRNALRNGIENARFICAPAEKELPRLIEEGLQVDVLTLDPPRKGCEEAFLQAVIRCQVPRLVYVSCSPGTLARDVKILTAGGYRLEKAQPVDMFPHTGHVETVVLLSK